MFRTVLTSLLAVLVLCGSAFAAEKTLIAAANPTWPPMEFLDENKNIIGYDRDIIAAIAEEIGMGGSGQLKKYVTESVNEYFAPIRARREELVQDMDYVKDVLHEGNRRANEVAEATLAEVREAMGMVY